MERFVVWRETAKKRMVAKLRAIKAELRYRMTEPAKRLVTCIADAMESDGPESIAQGRLRHQG